MEPAADGQRPLLHTPPSTVPDSMDVAVGNGSQWGSGAAAGEFEDPPGNVSAWWCCSTSGNGSHAGRVLEAPPTEKNWAALLVLAVVAVTITGNLLVIVAVSLEKKLQSATNYFLMSLAVADMLLGILVMPVSMVTVLYGVSAPVPVLGLLDRSTVFRGGSCLLTDELFVLVGSLVAFFLPLGIMGVSYFLTIHALQQEPPPCLERLVARPKWSGTLTLSFLPQSSLSSVGWGGVGGDRGGVYGRRSLQSVSNERRASKVLGVVFLLFVVMWAPFFITNVLAVVCDPPACDAGLMGALLNVFVWVGYLSSAVNPLVYTLFNRTYRAAFLRFVRCRYRPRPQKTPLQLMLVHTLPPMTYSSAELGGASTVTDREGRGFCPAGRQTDESCV